MAEEKKSQQEQGKGSAEIAAKPAKAKKKTISNSKDRANVKKAKKTKS